VSSRGERVVDTQVSVTWVALAGLIQIVVVLGGTFLFAGDLRARVNALEGNWNAHRKETVHRVEFEKLDAGAVRKEEFGMLRDQLNRVEAKLDALMKR
jgi:hypothetical protein